MIALYIVLYLLIGFITSCLIAKFYTRFDEDEDLFIVNLFIFLWPVVPVVFTVIGWSKVLLRLINKVAGK